MGRLLIVILFLGVQLAAFGQRSADAHMNEGDRFFQQMAYARAARSYHTAVKMGARNEHVTRRLGESHMKLGNPEEAAKWYGDLMKFLNVEPRDMMLYADALKGIERYEEAQEWMDKYYELVANGAEPQRSNIMGFARKLGEGEPRFTIRPTEINSSFSDFGTAWLGSDRVLFVSARNVTVGIERKAAWNDQPFLDLFVAELTPDGGLAKPQLLDGSVNTNLHEGPASASANGQELWFTRNGPPSRGQSASGKPISRLGIHAANSDGDGFASVKPFMFNDPSISVAHPALSKDGNTLYFASDMPGGYGGMDLYVTTRRGGEWSEPRNLGPTVNTARNEVFPFIAVDGTLYFASNGHPGLGGLDVFAAKSAGKGFGAPINVGAPVNSPRDDFAFIIDDANKRGFFSSNRPGGAGGDDIYAFTMLAPLEQAFLCNGVVYDDEYGTPVIGAEVQLFDLGGALLGQTTSGARGDYFFPVEKDRAYRIVAKLRGRFDAEQHLSTERIDQEQIVARDLHLVADAGVWLRGAVKRKDRLGFIPGVTVSVVNIQTYQADTRQTGPGGDINIRLQTNEEFEVLLEKKGFFSISVPLSTMGMRQGLIDLGAARDLVMEPLEIGVPNTFRFVNWTSGKTTLDPLARTELDNLAERLMVNPAVVVELAVHGNTGEDADMELFLSRKRAETMATYLAGKGINKDRVKHKGYGVTNPLNHCVPGVQCSPEEHAANRRATWTVLEVLE